MIMDSQEEVFRWTPAVSKFTNLMSSFKKKYDFRMSILRNGLYSEYLFVFILLKSQSDSFYAKVIICFVPLYNIFKFLMS